MSVSPHRDEDGHYHITGRMDDVINVTGHRLGTAEVEDAMVSTRRPFYWRTAGEVEESDLVNCLICP